MCASFSHPSVRVSLLRSRLFSAETETHTIATEPTMRMSVSRRPLEQRALSPIPIHNIYSNAHRTDISAAATVYRLGVYECARTQPKCYLYLDTSHHCDRAIVSVVMRNICTLIRIRMYWNVAASLMGNRKTLSVRWWWCARVHMARFTAHYEN